MTEKEEDRGWTTARISLAVRLYLDNNSMEHRKKTGLRTRESVDNILRRIFGIREE